MSVSIAEKSEKYDLRVPRYTSYPTSPHFQETDTDQDYRDWLGKLDPKAGVSLYIHVPFCDSMCSFCGCYTKIVKRYDPVSEYLEYVHKEIDLLAAALPARMTAKHVHWGGGSPTMLKAEDWKSIIDKLKDVFDIDDSSELAVELDPRTATEDYVKAIAAAGINRASIGVQDFHEEVQVAINRVQPFETTKQVVEWLKKYGITSINFDLLYGLPFQTTERVTDMVEKAVSLGPKRFAVFGYAHVPWMKSHMKLIPEEALPNAMERWEQMEAAAQKLEELGFVKIGLDHYAREDDEMTIAMREERLHRNFQGYTVDNNPVMLPLGASSIGQTPLGYVANVQPLRDYKRMIDAGILPVGRTRDLSSEDILRREVIEQIMCNMKVDLAAMCNKHNVAEDFFADEIKRLQPLVEDEICTLDNHVLSLPEEGRPLMRMVAATFDTYLQQGQKKHSRAV
ncbi:oxygen-independent coproporphyrinogen III oxidase [Terasakiella sp. SH-1]|uniref:oxygen-independent coproporphyrinogen III oxidase n=1 Tax=Terasakiella sp. SH-1 TaxID=2560057 RepID=UPI0010743F2D|nr:oxygen-independent coproporphyrinogen III oxidase [Terasakiella sp. SH-1]